MEITYRQILPEDNQEMAAVIRRSLEEHGVARPGTVYTDPTTDALFELFLEQGSIYWVALADNKVIGGCGVFPTKGLPDGFAELVKLYVSADFRGQGVGNDLMAIASESAKELGYSKLYLETLPELSRAVSLYERAGYELLEKPLGESGHFACDIWMVKEL